MHGKDYTHTSIPYAVPFLVMVAMATAMMATLAWTQNAIPPTARQAGTVQAFAPPLNSPGKPQTVHKFTPSPTRNRRSSPLYGNLVYENGPVDGQDYAWTINFGFTVSDSIQMNTSVSGMQFWAWLIPGDTLTSVEVQFGANPFGNELFDQTVNLTSSNCFSNQFGYNVCLESADLNGPGVSGNAWVTLSNASVPSGDPVYWDMNSGVGCQSPGCPSQAQENTIGTVPSEAFSILGNGPPPPPPCFEPGGNVQIIHDFTVQEGASSGVTIDQAGNLYGTSTGNNGTGLAFKLARWADWMLDPLYSFAGGYNGGNPDGVMVGPNGALYGGASGGNQACGNDGSEYCGLIFKLTPPPTACRSTLCGWMENVLYRSSGGVDPSIGMSVSALDTAGNLYGTSLAGGAYGVGTVFKLTPSHGGWTESVLYSFTGGNYGYSPSQVLVGNDGNLYGVASGGVYDEGVVFQLSPSGDHWTESVLHSFQWSNDGGYPSYLVQDGAGNLYGIALWYSRGTIFMLSKAGSSWVFSEYYIEHPYGSFEYLNNLAIDAAGNLYGTGQGGQGCNGARCNESNYTSYNFYAYIFTASHGSGAWQYHDLAFYGNFDFSSTGALALDPQGNIYGTTRDCGQYQAGTVWQFSP